MNLKRVCFTAFIITIIITMIIASFSEADGFYNGPFYVDASASPGGDGKSWATAFQDIQSAIDATSCLIMLCTAPETIFVKAGIYSLTSTIRVGRPVEILGGYGGQSIVDGNNRVRCFRIGGWAAPVLIKGFTIRNGIDGRVGSGGGILIDSPPEYCELMDKYHPVCIEDCIITQNKAHWGGGIYDSESNSIIKNCIFSNNRAFINGGGFCSWRSHPTIEKCVFTGNEAYDTGGAIFYDSDFDWSLRSKYSYGSITNSLFNQNKARTGLGGAIRMYNTRLYISNCTFWGNEAHMGGGAIDSMYEGPCIANCICWEDTPLEIDMKYPGSWLYVKYSDIQGGYSGIGNINEDPQFITIMWPNCPFYDFHLAPESPCIDTGLSVNNSEDLDGESRPLDGDGDGTARFDMGAYEFSFANVTPLNYGVACKDTATGEGYLMYSEESVHTRFSLHPPHPDNADHFIGVTYDGNVWRYDNNSAYYTFAPRGSDILVAEVDFTNDTVRDYMGDNGLEHGIAYGYAGGDIVFYPNQWGGSYNSGEFGITGTSIIPNPVLLPVDVTPLNYGVACKDTATGLGYLMYSTESVHTRFSSHPPNSSEAPPQTDKVKDWFSGGA